MGLHRPRRHFAVEYPASRGIRITRPRRHRWRTRSVFSPDGRWIGFLAGGKLKQVPVAGGSPVVLCDATDLLGASWDDDGSIVATLNSKGILWRVPSGGGVPAPIVDLSKDGVGPRWPQVLPGGTHVLYSAIKGFEADHGSIEVLSIRDADAEGPRARGDVRPVLVSRVLVVCDPGNAVGGAVRPRQAGDARAVGPCARWDLVLLDVRLTRRSPFQRAGTEVTEETCRRWASRSSVA